MASLIYNSFLEDINRGNIDPDTDTFRMLLVTSSYTANKDTHDRRDDITNEVANGNGYTTNGVVVTCTVARDNATDRVTLTFASGSWPTSTITARGAVVYKSRGGAASADELVFYNDFGSNVETTATTLTVAASVITYQN
jgi:hypothetical protein